MKHSSEQITAANDKVRAEAEQKRLEAAAAQLETARSNGQQQIDALQAALTESRGKAEEAASLQARLTAKIDLLTAEMNRIAEGDDNFVAQQTELSQKLSAKRLEPPEGCRTGLQPDRSAATAGTGCRCPPRHAGRKPYGTGTAQRELPGRNCSHPAGKVRQPDRDRPKRKGNPGSHRTAAGTPAG